MLPLVEGFKKQVGKTFSNKGPALLETYNQWVDTLSGLKNTLDTYGLGQTSLNEFPKHENILKSVSFYTLIGAQNPPPLELKIQARLKTNTFTISLETNDERIARTIDSFIRRKKNYNSYGHGNIECYDGNATLCVDLTKSETATALLEKIVQSLQKDSREFQRHLTHASFEHALTASIK